MTPGHPTADLIFGALLPHLAAAYEYVRDHDTDDLRAALAALSVFRGPGTIARDVAVEIIKNELAARVAENGAAK